MEMGASAAAAAAADVEQKEEDDTVCLDQSFFINDEYVALSLSDIVVFPPL